MVRSECCVSFELWCVRRSRVFEAHGTPQLLLTPETVVSDCPRKGRHP
jgi:hypothetical protein